MGNSIGQEDGAIALNISASIDPKYHHNSPHHNEHDPNTLTIVIQGVPAGATLSAGSRNADGSWTLTQAELSGLKLTPPSDFSGTLALNVIATAPRHGWKIPQSEASFTVQVNGVADTPQLTVQGTSSGVEDGVVTLDIQTALTDGDGSETLAVILSGVPAGAILSAGTDNGDGTWSLTGADLVGLTLTPAAGFSGDINLGVLVTASEANGSTASASSSIAISVAAVADTPDLVVQGSASGSEDGAIALTLSAALTDGDGSETLAVILSGVPTGAVLSAGTLNPDGTWSLTGADLVGLTLTPATGFSGDINLGVLVTASEANGSTASATSSIAISVAAVADTPDLVVQGSATGSEDGAIALTLSAALTDGDGSETLAVILSGVPTGAVLSAGTLNPDGTWSLTGADLVGLTLTPATGFSGDINLGVLVTASEANGSTATATSSIAISVAAVADTPDLVVQGSATGSEDGAIALTLSAALTDGDGSETLAVILSGVPTGAVLSAGTDNGDGTWSLTGADLVGLTLTPAAGFSGDINLGVLVTASEANGSTASATSSIAISVAAVADTPDLVLPAPITATAGIAVALNIAATLTDLDGSESLTVTIANLPVGSTLSAGTDNGNGTWTLSGAQLAGLTLTPPSSYSGTLTIAITAIAMEANGSTATTSGSLNLTVEGESCPSLIMGTSANNTLNGTEGHDCIYGLEGNDSIKGNGGDDTIYGGAGNDNLYGNAGDDTIYGGAGVDYFEGGDGNDTFVVQDVNSVDSYYYGGNGYDIVDATAADSISISGTYTLTYSVEEIIGDGDTRIIMPYIMNLSATTLTNISEITVTGSNLWRTYASLNDDFINVFGSSNAIYGGGGNDTFFVNNGAINNSFSGDAGYDIIDASTVDELNLSSFNGDYYGDWRVEEIIGNGNTKIVSKGSMDFSNTTLTGISEIHAVGNTQHVFGSNGDDVIYGHGGFDQIRGMGGNDTFVVLDGDSLTYYFTGGDGYDIIDATDTNTMELWYLVGGHSIEEIIGNGNTRIMGADQFNDRLDFSTVILTGIVHEFNGFSGDDSIVGTQTDDIIIGGAGSDALVGNGGNDTFIVREGDGADWSISGGTGYDIIDATGTSDLKIIFSDTLEENIGNGATTITSYRAHMYFDNMLISGIAEIRGNADQNIIRGSLSDDTIVGGLGADSLSGGGGNDTFIIREGDGIDSYIVGGEGYDVIDATGTSNLQIVTYSSYNTVEEIIGNGSLLFSSGINNASGGSFDLRTTKLTGITEFVLFGNDGINNIYGSQMGETIYGNGGGDALYGSGGNDIIVGGTGTDYLYGDDGDDTFIVNEGDGLDYSFSGGNGNDTIDATATSNLQITSYTTTNVVENILGNGTTRISGSSVANTLDFRTTLLSGISEIHGLGGNDTIYGSAGNDLIFGDTGSDTLYGGGGNDTFCFETGSGADWLRDFSAGAGVGDVIDLSAHSSGYTSLQDVLAHTTQSGTTATIDLGGGDTISIANVNMNTLDADDFSFG